MSKRSRRRAARRHLKNHDSGMERHDKGAAWLKKRRRTHPNVRTPKRTPVNPLPVLKPSATGTNDPDWRYPREVVEELLALRDRLTDA